eukprot:comp9000_c0_seq1/m.4198 comp9000_c0_seq1/g.4198  ORF comp9000_c0_seq1/g.4198 comp9000_c0_seq1/m.4198 type:complete len:163 (-) comp9000_c0_seq1:82-570(-)
MSGLLSSISALIRRDGSEVTPSALAGKPVLLYFSAHWCPPCRAFTPVLREWYDEVNDNEPGAEVEVVFVSSDKTEAEARKYMHEMHANWLMVPFSHPMRQELKKRYGFFGAVEQDELKCKRNNGIPTLALVKQDGTLVLSNGEDLVRSKGPRVLAEWKKAAQ